ncbi:hypothetical protein NK718_19750 [Alsobacter sp. SYSU M60028]|uniref:Chromosome partition protein Smc n=1 Tax=Alsobacter ponti TaxID=2962936 RepID=A0ABT1LGY7_9HYPH|nr:hypothetical protein [Alsobacter ponti]MCP8940767.1 hypothetical protein [Alsobacter ponti]
MHPTLVEVQHQLEKVIGQLNAYIPNDEPLCITKNDWSVPGLTRAELVEEAQSLIDTITEKGGDHGGDWEPRVSDYIRRLRHLQGSTIPQLQNNPNLAVPAYMLTLGGLRKAIETALDNRGHADAVAQLRKARVRLRGMEARLNELEPRTESLATMVERIEQAFHAADQLPADLESLEEARQKLSELLRQATQDHDQIADLRYESEGIEAALSDTEVEAKAVLQKCETAYSAATSKGLAAAFAERSSTLAKSMWFWVSGLAGALVAGSIYGSSRITTMVELFKDPNPPISVVIPNLMLSVLSVGAPIWFAWLSTKQIGQRFKLSEDYAFKASVARAYEGFRREAARIDKELETKLLASALTRLDELPLRLVETETHGSPWHELFQSDLVRQALKTGPAFAAEVRSVAEKFVARNSLARNRQTAATGAGEEKTTEG